MQYNREVQDLAEELYDDCPSVKPSWDQLGDATKSVWCDKALQQLEKEKDQCIE